MEFVYFIICWDIHLFEQCWTKCIKMHGVYKANFNRRNLYVHTHYVFSFNWFFNEGLQGYPLRLFDLLYHQNYLYGLYCRQAYRVAIKLSDIIYAENDNSCCGFDCNNWEFEYLIHFYLEWIAEGYIVFLLLSIMYLDNEENKNHQYLTRHGRKEISL